jgi:catechol 2,3-dioxygenase-like lactoylglutathione lyase family enzyme
MIREFKSIVLTSDTPDATAAFYRDVLGLPLLEERHRGTVRHHACALGSLHFAILERSSFWVPSSPAGEPPSTVVSFTVEDLDAVGARLSSRDVPIVARTKIGPMSFAAAYDPDGRHICFGTPWPSAGREGPPARR